MLKNAILIFAVLLFITGKAFGEADVSKFEIFGYRLGMTVDEVRKKNPKIDIREAKLDDGKVVGYQAYYKKLMFRFSSKEEGARLFHIVYYELYRTKPDPYPIVGAYMHRYGMPDSTGRDMWNINVCWGKCYGKNPRMELKMKISGIKGGFPLNLSLLNPAEEASDWMYFDPDEGVTIKR